MASTRAEPSTSSNSPNKRIRIPRKEGSASSSARSSGGGAHGQQPGDSLTGIVDLTMARNALSRPEVSASLKGDEGAPKLFDPDGPGESLVFKLVLAVSADALVAFVRGLLQLAETLGGPSLDKPFVNTAAASSLLEILRKWPTPGDISKGGHPHPNCLPLSETLILSQLSAAALEVRRSIEAARQVPPANSTPANPPTAGKPNLPEPTITASAPTDAFIIWAAGELNNGNYLGLTHFLPDRLDRLVSKVQRANDGASPFFPYVTRAEETPLTRKRFPRVIRSAPSSAPCSNTFSPA
jgi:hypothetical protein